MDLTPSINELILLIANLLILGAGGAGFRSVSGKATTHQNKIASLEQQASTQSETIATARKERDEQKKANETLQKDIDQLRAELGAALEKVAEMPALYVQLESYKKIVDRHQTQLDKANDDVVRERTRAGKAESQVDELRSKVTVLDQREDKTQVRIIDISADLKGRTVDCALKDSEIKRLARRVRELEGPPPPPTTEPDIAPGAHDGEQEKLTA